MKHDFFQIKKELIPDYTGEAYINDFWVVARPSEKISVHDDTIVNNPLFLKGFKSFKVSFKNPSEGLDYHGITIIPDTSIPDFLANVVKAKDETADRKIQQQLQDLIALCEKATRDNLYVIHFGL